MSPVTVLVAASTAAAAAALSIPTPLARPAIPAAGWCQVVGFMVGLLGSSPCAGLSPRMRLTGNRADLATA